MSKIPSVVDPNQPSVTSAQCDLIADWACGMLNIPSDKARVFIGPKRCNALHTVEILKVLLFTRGLHTDLSRFQRELKQAGRVKDQRSQGRRRGPQTAQPQATAAKPTPPQLSGEQVARLAELNGLKEGGARLEGDVWQELITLRRAAKVADGGKVRKRSRKPRTASPAPADEPVAVAVISSSTQADAASPARA